MICLGLADNTFLILHNSSDDTQPHSFIIPGVFRFIKDNFINSPSADLTPEVMDMLMAVMLVCLYQHVNSPCLLFCILFTPFPRIQLLISSILLAKPAELSKLVSRHPKICALNQGFIRDLIFHILYYYWGKENHSLLQRSLLYRGLLYRWVFTVLEDDFLGPLFIGQVI